MNKNFLFVVLLGPFMSHGQNSIPSTKCERSSRFTLALHKGTGPTSPEAKKFTEGLLMKGHQKLLAGENSLDVVQFMVEELEDSGLFNAGKTAVKNSENEVELDASIMDGKTLKAGAVAAVKRIKNPVALARLVKENSKHVLIVGTGAEKFARSQKMKLIDPKTYFKERPIAQMGPTSTDHWGTVGAVALDRCGNLASATSTGGLRNKAPGRVGDSPIIGAGTYANNQSCAVSATGDGEYFIRANVAHTVSSLIEHKKLPLQKAANLAIDKVSKLGGEGGLISVDSNGNVAAAQNTEITTAYVKEDGKILFLENK